MTPTLLITDDDTAFRETLCEAFLPHGFRTLTASDGDQAVEMVQRESVHVLLLDMHMPRLSGIETIRQVGKLQIALPCILMSARMDEDLVAQAKAEDVYSVLAKPFRFSIVSDLVCQAFRDHYKWWTR